jgi:hypothetical protein
MGRANVPGSPKRKASGGSMNALSGPDLAAYQEAAFKTYVDAFHKNAADPNLARAIDLVRAWNQFAASVGLDGIEV